jgi:FtsZ-interacting cell division protein ZipA
MILLGKIVYLLILVGFLGIVYALCSWADRREKSRGFSKKCLNDLENRYYEKD